jgi:hypothetical protein
MNRLRQCTVKLPQLVGQGVLVKGGFVLTASHCLQWDYDTGTGATLGGQLPFDIVCSTGKTFRLGAHFVDVVSDVAVLGPLDSQVFPEDCEAFEAFCNEVDGLDICKTLPNEREEFPLKVWSHEGFEIDCTGDMWDHLGTKIWVTGPIKGGTSGGPIVNQNGELISIVSQISIGNKHRPFDGPNPIVWRTLPEFIREQMLAADDET